MEIGNNDNDEQRRVEQRREQTRLEQERRQKAEPMRTFESKLAEKASHEAGMRESQAQSSRQQQKDAKERQSLIDKILGAAAKDKEETLDKSRVSEKKFLEQHESENREEGRAEEIREKGVDEKIDDTDDAESGAGTERKSSEYAQDGHRRVAEKQGEGDFGGALGGGAGDQGFSGGESGAGGSNAGSGFGGERGGRETYSAKEAAAKTGVAAAKEAGAQRGFQQNARPFKQRDLDEIVAKVQVGVEKGGDEFFSVELTDEYFGGLKLKAVRTEKGVVLKFLCPDLAVRSTFIRYRPMVYAQLKAKNISVFRIDVV